jgi:transcriptional/translational regulatory protein YebC/TACO1
LLAFTSVILQFYCNTKELHDVKAALEGEGLDVIEGRFAYVPITFAKLSGMDLKYCGELLDLLMDYDDVVRIYDNVAAQEEAESTSN